MTGTIGAMGATGAMGVGSIRGAGGGGGGGAGERVGNSICNTAIARIDSRGGVGGHLRRVELERKLLDLGLGHRGGLLEHRETRVGLEHTAQVAELGEVEPPFAQVRRHDRHPRLQPRRGHTAVSRRLREAQMVRQPGEERWESRLEIEPPLVVLREQDDELRPDGALLRGQRPQPVRERLIVETLRID